MGGMTTDIKLLDENGRRVDGRTPEEMRPLRIEAGVLKRADGSAYVEWGLNKVLAAVYGPRECHPRHMQNPTRALVQCKYNMAAFSVDDRKRPGPDRRSQEISKITSEALTHVVFTEYFPRASIDVYVEVLQANAGTRCAGLTAASVALADAGVPMRDLVASCAAGKAAGTMMVDLGKEEDNFGEADIPVGYVPRTKEIVLLQMDGDLTLDEYKKGLNMAIGGCEKVYEAQREALRRRYEARPVDAAARAPEGSQAGVA